MRASSLSASNSPTQPSPSPSPSSPSPPRKRGPREPPGRGPLNCFLSRRERVWVRASSLSAANSPTQPSPSPPPSSPSPPRKRGPREPPGRGPLNCFLSRRERVRVRAFSLSAANSPTQRSPSLPPPLRHPRESGGPREALGREERPLPIVCPQTRHECPGCSMIANSFPGL